MHSTLLSLLIVGITSVVFQQINADQKPNGALVAVETEDDEEDGIIITAENKEVSFADELDPNVEPFIPSNEWQTVKEGQAIPRGLHVRLDMQTGAREAKLLEEEAEADKTQDPEQISVSDSTEPSRLLRMKEAISAALKDQDQQGDALKYWKDGDKQGMASTKKDTFSREELKEALKKFKATSDDVKDKKIAAASSGKQFRSVDELKAELKDLDLNLKTDPEMMRELLKRYKDSDLSTSDRQNILTDLEYYVHQIDNALDFVDMGGLLLITKELNHTEADIRSEAALLIGSAVQSNPKVQVGVLEAGIMYQLTRMLSTENEDNVKTMILYALSALLRHFPYAQQKFIEQGGVHSLTHLLSKGDSIKLKVKTVTLINDLMQEQQGAARKQSYEENDKLRERLKQYESVHLLEKLLEQGWCDLIPALLSVPEHDSREKIIIAMETLMESCQHPFVKAIPHLKLLEVEYSAEATEEQKLDDTDTYFQDLLNRIMIILNKLEIYSRKVDL